MFAPGEHVKPHGEAMGRTGGFGYRIEKPVSPCGSVHCTSTSST